MTLRWYSVVVDSHDVASLGRWWAETLGYVIAYEADDELVIAPPWMPQDPAPQLDAFLRAGQAIVFVPVTDAKTVKNRLHIDLAPHTSQDREAAIDELIARGATRTDVGQGPDVTWTVLADPEGNEFCVLSSRDE